ncbi:DEAD/DEAH box helicase domain-containing protein-like protein [Dinothrombium tinctorium]|uniref:DEAD/DEAH box helicase domain-containing protein-like protein n=1 Tax=Dinothrombium tinctorium TaxID=1965070 RepID=A0A3S3P3E5_9ACAR|nr:DEAD/DEAH box helicase domain-containing protein-like protein [Dinothrombium tinctorium]
MNEVNFEQIYRLIKLFKMSREFDTSWRDLNYNFETLDLNQELVKALNSMKIYRPSNIQFRAIMAIKNGFNLCMECQFQKHETIILVISILEKISVESEVSCQAIILSSDSNVIKHIADTIEHLGLYLNVKICICTHHSNLVDNINHLNNGVNIIIGNPGRIYDLIGLGVIKLQNIKIMASFLDMKKIDNYIDVAEMTPKTTQKIIFTKKINEININLKILCEGAFKIISWSNFDNNINAIINIKLQAARQKKLFKKQFIIMNLNLHIKLQLPVMTILVKIYRLNKSKGYISMKRKLVT